MSDTLSQLEQKLNVMQMVKDHPWPALALAVGAGVLLSGSKADVKAAAATALATRGASGRMGSMLDDLVAQLVTGVHGAFQQRVESWVEEVKTAIGAPAGNAQRTGAKPSGYGFTAGTEGGASRASMGNDRAPTNT